MATAYAVCVFGVFSLTASGLIRIHGPVNSCCRGSGGLPHQTNQDVSGDQVTSDDQCDPPHAPQNQPLRLESTPKVRVLKYIPKSAREQYGLNLG